MIETSQEEDGTVRTLTDTGQLKLARIVLVLRKQQVLEEEQSGARVSFTDKAVVINTSNSLGGNAFGNHTLFMRSIEFVV
jgi:hypothetical protein